MNTKTIFNNIRDGLCWSFTWLVILVILLSLIGGTEVISASFLLKLLLLCLWGVISFVVSFRSNIIKSKRFITRLTSFYVMFIPVEVTMFFFMNIFEDSGSFYKWIIFGAIVVFLYVACLVIDKVVFEKLGEDYTRKLQKYQEAHSTETIA